MTKVISIFLFLFSQNLFSAEYGIFMVVKGKVKIESAGLTAVAKVNSKIQVGDTVVTEKDSRAKIVMTDRNIINISPNTKLKIERYSNSEGDKNVNLNLIEGKVRNKVEQKYDNINSKFEVRTATAVAGVRGTDFITSYSAATKVTEVVTLKGQVAFQSAAMVGVAAAPEPIFVEKGEKSEAKDEGAPTPPIKVPEKELKQIDSDTTVKRKQPKTGAANNLPNQPVPNQEGAQPAPTSGATLIDMNSGNTQIIDDSSTRKFEKSKVKIITQPSN